MKNSQALTQKRFKVIPSVCGYCGHKRDIERKNRFYCSRCKKGEYGKKLKDFHKKQGGV